jgi:hypothetical protein
MRDVGRCMRNPGVVEAMTRCARAFNRMMIGVAIRARNLGRTGRHRDRRGVAFNARTRSMTRMHKLDIARLRRVPGNRNRDRLRKRPAKFFNVMAILTLRLARILMVTQRATSRRFERQSSVTGSGLVARETGNADVSRVRKRVG